jgi:hypothetical protein
VVFVAHNEMVEIALLALEAIKRSGRTATEDYMTMTDYAMKGKVPRGNLERIHLSKGIFDGYRMQSEMM